MLLSRERYVFRPAQIILFDYVAIIIIININHYYYQYYYILLVVYLIKRK